MKYEYMYLYNIIISYFSVGGLIYSQDRSNFTASNCLTQDT